jgi:beta-lactamase regulating signal transducer with metallopeptidase domain
MNQILALPWVADTAELVLPVLLDAALKSVVLLSMVLFLVAASRPFTSASRRHWLLVVGLAGLLLLPLLSMALPKWEVLPTPFTTALVETDVRGDVAIFDVQSPSVESARIAPPAAVDVQSPRPEVTIVSTEARALVEPSEIATPLPFAGPPVIAAEASPLPWPVVAVLLWIAGAIILLTRLAVARLYLARFTARSSPVRSGPVLQQLRLACDELGIRRPVRLFLYDSKAMPMMWGICRASILLPVESQTWSAGRLHTVLLHELAHVKRRDCMSQLMVQLTCALYWFNPLIWIAAWRTRVEREQACDDLVLSSGTKASDYAEHLLAVATGYERQRPAQAAALAMAHRLRIEGRLAAILNATLNRSKLSRRMAIGSLLVAAAVLVPVAMMQGYDDKSSPVAASQTPGSKTKTEAAPGDKLPIATAAEATVVGYVRDTQQQPVAGVKVIALLRKSQPTATSAADGRFQVNVPIKELAGLMVLARHDRGARQAFLRLSYEQEKPPDKPLSLVLQPAREIALTVGDDKNQPVGNAWAAAISSFQKIADATTDTAGNAKLLVPVDAPLQYVVASKAGVGVDYFVYRGKEDPPSDPYRLPWDHRGPLAMVLSGMRTVAVQVLDAQKKPLVGVAVSPWYFEKPNKGAALNSGLDEFNAVTDARGIATIASIPADNTARITFWVRAEGYFAPQRWVWDPKSDSNNLTATLLPMVKVRGSAALPDGSPAANLEIKVSGGGHQIDEYSGSTRTGKDGKFEILVYPDQYYMLVPISKQWSAPAHHMIVRQSDRDGVKLVLQPATRVHGRVTVGSDRAAWASGYIQLYLRDDTYYNLPENEQLPNPTNSNRAVVPVIVQSQKTGADGRFEFFAGPGHYYITGPENIKAPRFDITDQKELEVNIQLPGPERGEIAGRVVFKNDPTRGVSEARVKGRRATSQSAYLEAISGKDGRFVSKRNLAAMIVYAETSDGTQAGIVKVGATDKSLDIPIGPLGTARGRLLDEVTGEPLPRRQIEHGIRIDFGDGGSSTYFGSGAITDRDGRFTLGNIVPGWEYTISVVMEVDNEGHARSWYGVGKVTAKDTNVVEVGDLKLKPPFRPPAIK